MCCQSSKRFLSVSFLKIISYEKYFSSTFWIFRRLFSLMAFTNSKSYTFGEANDYFFWIPWIMPHIGGPIGNQHAFTKSKQFVQLILDQKLPRLNIFFFSTFRWTCVYLFHRSAPSKWIKKLACTILYFDLG